MTNERVLFITNEIFLNHELPEGGVRYCTNEYIELLKAAYQVEFLPVRFNRSLSYKIRARLGIDVYEEYRPSDYDGQLRVFFEEKKIRKVFINLANASAFSEYIKTRFAEYATTVVLCSHGNESGDFLHQSVRFRDGMSFTKRLFSAHRLGRVLQKESWYRQRFIDCVLTVSPVEESIEKWLGEKNTYMVPRVFRPDFIEWKPVGGRVGFIGDLSHPPNHYGILRLCEAIERLNGGSKIELRIAGISEPNTTGTLSRYPFVSFLGYMDNEAMIREASTWNYYLNPVFYYSKGVSTKLGKGINWGLPVISTTAGNRGYLFRGGNIITIDEPPEIVEFILERLDDPRAVYEDKLQVMTVAENSITYSEIITRINSMLEKERN